MKSFIRTLFLAFCIALSVLTSCTNQRQEIVIYFENDVHCAVETYSHIAALRDSALLHTPYVSVVSSGDYVQGDVVGSLSQGEYIIDIMNTVPYDVVTIGNHEFDYSVEKQQELMQRLTADVVCCNFSYADGRDMYRPYVIRSYGPVKVAFVGAATPSTLQTSTPAYFMNEQGEVIYNFHANDTYQLIEQYALMARKEGADHVVLLSHLGDNSSVDNSIDMIKQTRGIDVVLDGHAHNVLYDQVPNIDGDSVWILSTGSKGKYIGEMRILTDNRLLFDLIEPQSLPKAERVEKKIEEVKTALAEQINAVVGYSEVDLSAYDENGERLVRNAETNLGRFASDAIRVIGNSEIGVIHGGGLRSSINKGEITLGDLIALFPFNNHLAKVEMTGQQLLDALEVSVATYPEENGDFHICSGLRYTINPAIPSSVIWDKNNMYAGVGSTRRVVSVEVYDFSKNSWATINPQRVYTVSGLDYTLLNQGAACMFRYASPLPCDNIKDTDVLLRYLQSTGDTIRLKDYPQETGDWRFRVLYQPVAERTLMTLH